MKADMMASLARLPARQLNLVLGGALAIVVALLWTFALRAPLAAVRAQQAELARFSAPAAPAQAALLAAFGQQVSTLAATLGDGGNAAAGALQLRLIGEVDRAAARHGVLLHSAAPGPARNVGSFSEVAIDIEAAGSYPALLAWMGELEAGRAGLSVVSFDLRAGDNARQRIIKTRLAAYQAPKEQP